MATNGGNLPALIQYNKIKDITIFKLPGSMQSGSFNDAHGIKFTEIIEKEIVKHGIFRNKTKIETKEVEHFVPFSFKSFDIAKDFAQYLPGMKIWGERLYANENNNSGAIKHQLMYETYLLTTPNINTGLAVKFINECQHQTQQTIKKKETNDGNAYNEFYINDLDKKNFDGSQGHWYSCSELIVDYFFITYEFDFGLRKLNTFDKFETLSDYQKFENENTHKFILVEQ